MQISLHSIQNTSCANVVRKGNWSQLQPIRDCAEGRVGNKLQREMEKRTKALRPKLNWVPWIVLNNVRPEDLEGRDT